MSQREVERTSFLTVLSVRKFFPRRTCCLSFLVIYRASIRHLRVGTILENYEPLEVDVGLRQLFRGSYFQTEIVFHWLKTSVCNHIGFSKNLRSISRYFKEKQKLQRSRGIVTSQKIWKRGQVGKHPDASHTQNFIFIILKFLAWLDIKATS